MEKGCDEIQGWYFSKALPEDQILPLMLDNIFLMKKKAGVEFVRPVDAKEFQSKED